MWREKLLASAPGTETDAVLMDFFRAKFNEVGARGCQIIYGADWREGDETKPFFGLCLELAEELKTVHEFRPYTAELYGSGQPVVQYPNLLSGICGLRVKYDNCLLVVVMYANTTEIDVCYLWPESYNSVDEDGRGSGGSHSSHDFKFDLVEPGSVEAIRCRFKQLCLDMLEQWRPTNLLPKRDAVV